MNPWTGIVLTLAVLGGLFLAIRFLQRRYRWHGELARKAIHIGMGLLCAAFPWMFDEAWPVVLLAGLSIATLLAVRSVAALRDRFIEVLGGVSRSSLGEYVFPVAVALVFVLSAGDPLTYTTSILTLAIADAAGALVGLRYGLSKFRTDEGEKSAEGSLAIFIATFFIAHVPLLLFSSIGRAESLLTALAIALLVTFVEAISLRGLDNLIIPLTTFFLIRMYPGMTTPELALRVAVLVGLVGITLASRNRTTLNESGLLASALIGYLIWAFGGWLWLAGGVLLFVIYVTIPCFASDRRPIQDMNAVTRTMSGGVIWLAAALALEQPWMVVGYLGCLAAHSGNIVEARLRVLEIYRNPFLRGLAAVLLVGSVFSPLVWAASVQHELPVAAAVGILWAVVGTSVAAFCAWWDPTPSPRMAVRRFWAEAAIAPTVSLWYILLLLPGS